MAKGRKQNRAGDKTPSPPPEPAASPVMPTIPPLPLATAVLPLAAEAPIAAPAEVPSAAVPAEGLVGAPMETPTEPMAEVPAEVLPVPTEPEAAVPVSAVSAATAPLAESGVSSTLPDVPAELIDSCGESPAPKPPARVQFKEPAAHDFVSAPRFSSDAAPATRGQTPARAEGSTKTTVSRKGHGDGEAKDLARKGLSLLVQKLKAALVWFFTDSNPRIRIARLLVLCVVSLKLAHFVTRLRGPNAIKA